MLRLGAASVIAVGLSLCIHVDAVSQYVDSSEGGREAALRGLVKTLEPAERLRLRAGTDLLEGTLVAQTGDSLAVDRAGAEIHLALRGVDSLWVRRHHARTGFLVGGAVGIGTYALLTSIEEETEPAHTDNVVGLLFLGASVALGSAVGRLIPRWKRVYP